tara:strand:+ start:86 stop:712 length:627 start_codon:yes stop_codon:yes gene_type:complete
MKNIFLIQSLFLFLLNIHSQTSVPTNHFVFYYLENPSSSVNKDMLLKYFDHDTFGTDLYHFIVVNSDFCVSVPDESHEGFNSLQKDSMLYVLQNYIENKQDVIKHDRLGLKQIRSSMSNIFNQIIDCSILEKKIFVKGNYSFSIIVDTDDFSKYFNNKSRFFSLFNSIPFISLLNENSIYEYVVSEDVFKNIDLKTLRNYSNYSLNKL